MVLGFYNFAPTTCTSRHIRTQMYSVSYWFLKVYFWFPEDSTIKWKHSFHEKLVGLYNVWCFDPVVISMQSKCSFFRNTIRKIVKFVKFILRGPNFLFTYLSFSLSSAPLGLLGFWPQSPLLILHL